MLHEIVLWLFVVFSGIAAGAGLYELRVNVPRWFPRSSDSAPSVDVDAITTDDSGRRFWAYVTTGPLTLLTIAGCVFAWNPAEPRSPRPGGSRRCAPCRYERGGAADDLFQARARAPAIRFETPRVIEGEGGAA